MDIVVAILIAALPIAIVAYFVTLPMRLRLGRAVEVLDTVVAGLADESKRVGTLERRMHRAEEVLTRAGEALPPLPAPQSAVEGAEAGADAQPGPIVVSAEAWTGLPDGEAVPAGRPPPPVERPAAVVALAARGAGAQAVAEAFAPPSATEAEMAETLEAAAGGPVEAPPPEAALASGSEAIVEAGRETPVRQPAGLPPERDDGQREEPAGIVISADSWTGRGEVEPAPEPEIPVLPPGEEREEPAEEGVRTGEPAEAQEQAEPRSATILPFPTPAQPDEGAEAGAVPEGAEPGAQAPEPPEAPEDESAAAMGLVWAEPEPEVQAEAGGAAPRREAGRVAQALTGAAALLSRLTTRQEDRPRNWETVIGGRWLNLIGMVLLVIGVVLLTQQAFYHLDARGRIAAGVAFSLALLLCGVLLEHRTAYRRIGLTLIGGGWALLYFDAYAAANLEQVKVIGDPTLGLAAMVAVAAGMVAHSLRYRSQFITGVAFGLGYLAVILTPVSLESLVASAVLAAGLAVVSWSLSWQFLFAAGVVAAYSNHWLWLRKVAGVQAGGPHLPLAAPSQGFWISSAIVAFYWIIFAAVSLSRRMDKEMSRQLHLSVGVANAIGMLGLITLQLMQGYGGHYLAFLSAPAALGYVVLARGEYRLGQRIPFLFAATLALGLAGATLPLARSEFDVDLAWLAPILLACGLLALRTGVGVGEVLLRAEGHLLALASFALLAGYNLARPGAADLTPVWFAGPAMAIAYQATSEWVRRRADDTMLDLGPASLGFAIAAALALAQMLWVQLPRDTVGLAILVAGGVATGAGARSQRLVPRIEGHLLAALAFAILLGLNLNALAPLDVVTAPRAAIVLAAAAGFYGLSWRLMTGRWALHDLERRFAWVPSAAGSVLVVVLAFGELERARVCAALAAWGVVLFETGLRSSRLPVRLQGYAVVACATAAALVFNGGPDAFGGTAEPRSWLPALAAVAALWWLFRRLARQQGAVHALEAWLGPAASIAANALSAEILWKVLPPDVVGLAWAAGSVVLFGLALRLDEALLRLQSYAVLGMAFAMLVGSTFGLPPGPVLTVSRWLSVAPAIVIHYAMTAWIETAAFERHPAERALSFLPSALGTALVALLVWFELDRALVTAALSAWSLGLVEAGRHVRRAPIRVEGYALLLLAALAAMGINGVPAPGGSAPGPGSWAPAALTVAALWWTFRRTRSPSEDGLAFEAWLPESTSALATVLTAQVLLKELPLDLVGLAWLACGMALVEASAPVRRPALRVEGYGLQALAFCALLAVNCALAGEVAHPTAPDWALVVPGIAGLYATSARLRAGGAGATAREIEACWIPSALATALVVALAVRVLDGALLTAALSAWGLVLVEAGLRAREGAIRGQGYLLVALAVGLALCVNILAVPLGLVPVPTGVWPAWLPVLATTGVLAWLFVRLTVRPGEGGAIEVRLGELASCAASLLAALLVWKELSSLAVAVLWCALGFAVFQLSLVLRSPVLRAQAHLLLGASYVRLYMANFVALDATAVVTLRVATVLPVLLALACVGEQLRTTDRAMGRTGLLGRVLRAEALVGLLTYSYAVFLGLAVLCRFEFGREHTVAAWSALVLLFLVLGQRLDRQDFRFQSYVLAIYAVFRAWATNLHMDGTWLGLPERISTTLPMIAVLFIAAVAVAGPRLAVAPAEGSRLIRLLAWLDGRAHGLFAILASLFTAILLYYQLDQNTLSIGLALEGFCLLALGLVLNDRIFRLFGLGLLTVCLLKVVFYDLRGVETIYRILSFIVLGLILLLASVGYARYRETIEKLI